METIKYIPGIDQIDRIDELKNTVKPDESLLFGEYGLLNPLSLFPKIREIKCSKIYFELISKNKNRELIESFLFTCSTAGFDGVVIASGSFTISENMGKPVYDLDPSQILRLAISMKSHGKIDKNFIIGVRAASGNGPAKERALFLLNEGAEFIAVKDENISDDLIDRAVIIKQIEAP